MAGMKSLYQDQAAGQKAQDDAAKLTDKGTLLLHSKGTRDNILEMIHSNPNPVDGAATATSMIIMRVTQAARQVGEEPMDSAKIFAALDLLNQINQIGPASGAMPKLDKDELELALALSIQKTLAVDIKQGNVDPNALADSVGQAMRSLPEDIKGNLNNRLIRMDETARRVNDKYGQIGKPPKEAQAEGEVRQEQTGGMLSQPEEE